MSEAMSGPRVLTPLGASQGAGDDTFASPAPAPARRPAGAMERIAVFTMATTFAMQFALRPSGPGNSSLVDVFTLVSLVAVGLWAASAAVRIRVPYALGAGLLIFGGALAGLVSAFSDQTATVGISTALMNLGVCSPLTCPNFPAQALLAVMQDVVLLCWAWAVVAVALTPGGIRLLARAWAYSAIACAGVLMIGSLAHISAITGVVSREGNRALFTFGDPNYAAAFWVLSIFVCYASKVPQRRSFQVGAYLLLIWAIVLSESNGAWLELAAGWLLVLAMRVYHRYGMVASSAVFLLAAGLAALVFTVAPLSSVQAAARASGEPLLVNSIGRSSESSSQRSVLVRESLQLYETGNFLGTGPASTKPLLTVKGYPYAKEAHDDLLAAIVERGPFGLLGLAILVSSAACRATTVLRSLPPARPGALPRPVGLVAGLAAMAAASAYYEVLHFRFVWGLLALVAACAYEAREAARSRLQRGTP